MKNLILLLLIACNLCAFSEPKEVPHKTYKIIVKNNLSADENFALAGRTLIDNDYTIAIKDKDFYTIKTAKRELYKSRMGSYFLNFSIKDHSISVTGECFADLTLNFGGVRTENSSFKICYKGMNGSLEKDAFIRMADFAKKMGTEFECVTE